MFQNVLIDVLKKRIFGKKSLKPMEKPGTIRLVFLLLFLAVISTHAQDMSGVASDRYSGINRVHINPALIFHSPYCIDFSLLLGNFGFENNFVYVEREHFRPARLLDRNAPLYTQPRSVALTRDGVEKINGVQYMRLHGPSVGFRHNKQYFGITTGIRMMSQARQVPFHAARFLLEGLDYEPQVNILFDDPVPFDLVSYSWAEIGLSYARVVRENRFQTLVAGITLKPSWAYHGGVAHSDELSYLIGMNRTVNLYRHNFLAQGSLPLDFNTLDPMLTENMVKGRGLSFDLGLTYTRVNSSSRSAKSGWGQNREEYESYRYQLGLSLLDAGAMKIKTNTKKVEFDDVNLLWLNPNWKIYNNFDEFFDDMETRLVSGSIYRGDGEDFWLYMPTAVSMQFDYNLGNNLYANLMWVQDVPLARSRVERPSYVGIIPRYETRLFTLALPVTLYEFTQPRIGISARYWIFTLGTDNPGSWFGLNDLQGMDVYFSVRWGLTGCSYRRPGVNPCLNNRRE
jgi:hypothetical protein